MLLERAIEFTEQLITFNKHALSDREKNILRGSWKNLTYEAIKEHYVDTFSSCQVSFIKKVLGYKLWQKVTNAFVVGNIISPGSKVHKLNFRKTVNQYEQQHELNLEHSSEHQIIGDRYQVLSSIERTEYIKTIYLVQHLNYFDQECIVEQIKSTSDSNSNLEALARRARILRDLGEKTVCTPKLFGWFEKDQYWHLVYELIRGVSLQEEFNSHTTLKTEAEVKKLLIEILEVVDSIHQCNIVLGNIAPNNLIRRDRDGKIALIDFEIAKYINSKCSFFPALHHNLDISYIAPEFVTDPTFVSDLYSVGKIIIEALTRLTPNEYHHNLIDWRDRTNISIEFQDILDKMVLKKCCRRYQSAHEILRILSLNN